MGSHVLQHLDRGEPALPSAAESPGGLGSPHRPARHNPGSGGEAAAVGPPGDNPSAELAHAQSPPLPLGELPAAWRASQAADSKKMAADSAQAGEQRGTRSSNPKTAPIPDTADNTARCWFAGVPASCRDRPGWTKSRFDLGWRRMNTKSGLGSRRLHL